MVRGAQDAVGEIVGNQALVVIGEHQCVKFLERSKQNSQESFLSFSAERLAPHEARHTFASLLIDAHHVVVFRDDSRFHRGDAFRISDDSFVPDTRGPKTFLQGAPGFVISGNAKRFHPRAQRSDICGHVSRPAQALALLDEIHDRNRRFRREPRSRAPKVAVQHQVAEYADALAAQPRDQSFQPGNGIGNVDGHAISLIFLSLDRLFLSDLRFFQKHHGNFIAHRIDSAAGDALQARFVAQQFHACFANGANQNVESIFRNRHDRLRQRG